MNNTVENDFFWISQGKVAISDRRCGQICKISCQIFSEFNMPKFITRSSAIAEGPRDASCQLKSCQFQATVQKLLLRQVLTKSMV